MTRQVQNHLITKPPRYTWVRDHLDEASDETSACEISLAHPADLLHMSKLRNGLGNNFRIKNYRSELDLITTC